MSGLREYLASQAEKRARAARGSQDEGSSRRAREVTTLRDRSTGAFRGVFVVEYGDESSEAAPRQSTGEEGATEK